MLNNEEIKKLHSAIVNDSQNSCLNYHNFADTDNYLKAETLTVIEEIINDRLEIMRVSLENGDSIKTAQSNAAYAKMVPLHSEIQKLKDKIKEQEDWINWASPKIDDLENQVEHWKDLAYQYAEYGEIDLDENGEHVE